MNETSTVRGKVIRTSGEPLGKAEVTLNRNDMSQLSYVATSAADGQFLLEGVEPGQYRLNVERNGYVKETAADWFGGALVLTLAPGRQLEGIVVRMAPQAVVSGRLTDEDGDPVADASVTLLREMPVPEGKRLIPVGGQIRSTNDLGDFRIPGLVPGRYFLCANPDRNPHMGRRIRRGLQDQRAYPPSYFPGTTDLAQAAPIDVAAGEELHGFDMRVRKVRGFRVRGRVELPDGADPRSLHVNLGPHHLGPHGWIFGGGGGGGRAGGLDRIGETAFDLEGVLPGSYDLTAHCGVAQRSRNRTARVHVEVKDRDVEGLVVTFPSGFTVEGMVRALGDSARFNPTSVFVALHPEQHDNQLGGGPTDPAGAFTLFDVPPGRYRVWVHLMPEDGYVKAVQYGQRELSDNWMEIGQDGAVGKLEVLMAFDGGEVSGTVEDGNGAPLPGAAAHLLTNPPRFDLRKFAIADQDGRFWFRQIRPGEYWVFAVESLRPGVPWEQLWEQHEGVARKLTVCANGHEELLVRL